MLIVSTAILTRGVARPRGRASQHGLILWAKPSAGARYASLSRKWRRLCERRWRVWELAKRHVPAPCTNAARARYRPSLLAPIAPEGAASQPLTKTWGGKFALRSATCHGARSPPKMPAAKWQVSARMGRGGRAPFWHTVGRLFWGPRPEAEPPHVAGDASTQPRPEHRTGLTKMAARLPFFYLLSQRDSPWHTPCQQDHN